MIKHLNIISIDLGIRFWVQNMWTPIKCWDRCIIWTHPYLRRQLCLKMMMVQPMFNRRKKRIFKIINVIVHFTTLNSPFSLTIMFCNAWAQMYHGLRSERWTEIKLVNIILDIVVFQANRTLLTWLNFFLSF